MSQPQAPSTSSSSAPSSAVASSFVPSHAPEIVHRPDSGIARGVWEAPAWTFLVWPIAVLFLAAIYAAFKLGLVKRIVKRKASR